ncbi:outer membrane protein assembly factor BamE domain-containing protein [Pseudomonas typographi]|uniref:Outer membrane protein assembly factor BamE n=1 Tax=Pseudomonas typographi TaxID=2715964 RepID=A0ABR7ZAH5_9PSED|nr:hypothetical protein [Pseudomonas typographi]MBD1551865.1 outer membrane protein assembly factor BamE [Pseudomonas typographi]MBD1587669.1 outer membrane protein assembly factor BamE [Pseudomonas typographi]MBD1602303.1 outer membrane protein assembly factor BamE [Pseudomonas typographi]
MYARVLAVCCCCLALAGCNKLTMENYSKIKTGMGRAQVEQLLGKPVQCSGALAMASCTWGDEQRFVSVQFAADKVALYTEQGLQ